MSSPAECRGAAGEVAPLNASLGFYLESETRDAQQLGRRWAGMMRAVTSPVAAAAFAARPDSGALVDELYRRMETRIAATPQQNIHFLAIAVVRKTGA